MHNYRKSPNMTSKCLNPTKQVYHAICIDIDYKKAQMIDKRHESRYARIKHDIEWLPCQQNYRKRSNIPRNVDKTSTNVKNGIPHLKWHFYSTAARRALISSRLVSRYLSSRSIRSCSAVRYSESRSKSSWMNSLRVRRRRKAFRFRATPNPSRQQVAVAFRVPVIANVYAPLLVVKCNNALPSPVPEVGPVRLLATTLTLHLISHVQ